MLGRPRRPPDKEQQNKREAVPVLGCHPGSPYLSSGRGSYRGEPFGRSPHLPNVNATVSAFTRGSAQTENQREKKETGHFRPGTRGIEGPRQIEVTRGRSILLDDRPTMDWRLPRGRIGERSRDLQKPRKAFSNCFLEKTHSGKSYTTEVTAKKKKAGEMKAKGELRSGWNLYPLSCEVDPIEILSGLYAEN